MGYTHYFEFDKESTEWQAIWPRVVADARYIMEVADVLLMGWEHDKRAPPRASVEDGICFNGFAHDGHEYLCLGTDIDWGFVKTAKKPYDITVACILLRAKMLAPGLIDVQSDGKWDNEWKRVRQFYQELWPGEPCWCPWKSPTVEDLNVNGTHREERTARTSPSDMRIQSLPISDIGYNRPIESSTQNAVFNPASPTWSCAVVDQIRSWFTSCEESAEHAECKPLPLVWEELAGAKFKVIDTQRCCIVEAKADCPFVALTYVWGGVDQLRLNSDTASFLMRDGGINGTSSKLTTVVRDAISLCRQCGERYLWVDALCIMQDSVADMKLQIVRMRQIYSAAKCTIAAVSARTANDTLLTSEEVTFFESEAALDQLVDSSAWSNRAWCYQEKVLSHRIIYFTEKGIYMQCQKGTYNIKGTKLAKNETESTAKYNAVGSMLSISPGEDLESYVSAVEYYSQRKVTRLEDRKNAFEGVIRRYGGKMDGEYSVIYLGHPISAFDQVFCWRTSLHSPDLRQTEFPSWSWLGWYDKVLFDRKLLSSARTDQMLRPKDSATEQEIELRKPAQKESLYEPRDKLAFGFPASSGRMILSRTSELHLSASMADLRVAPEPIELDGSNGLYAVYPTRCGPITPPPPAKKISLEEYFKQTLHKFNAVTDEIEAAPSLPHTKQTSKEHNLKDHDAHDDCEAKTAIGYIWLDRKWREQRPPQHVLEFMAVAGVRNKAKEGTWTITMLMCMQRMAKLGHLWASERVQIMDCQIDEEAWKVFGAQTESISLS